MQGSLDINNGYPMFETSSMQGSVGDFGIEGMLSTPKPGQEKPDTQPADETAGDWAEAPPFLLGNLFAGKSSSLFPSTMFASKMRSGSIDGLFPSRELEREKSAIDMVGSLDLADVLVAPSQSQTAAASTVKTPSRDVAALDLPPSLGPRMFSGGMQMSISGSTENVKSFLEEVVENQSLPAPGSVQALLSPAAPAQQPPAQPPAQPSTFVAPAAVHASSQQAAQPAALPPTQPAVKRETKHQSNSAIAAAEPAHRDPAPAREPQAHLNEGSGSHVKSRPEMQRRARQGQEHWLTEVRAMRERWEEREECRKNDAFQWQVDKCGQLQIKSQHECILRALQLAACDELITPLPFSQDTDNSFLGWTGFQVHQEQAQTFRRRIENLFPVPLPENTLHTAFRRAGLVPDKWTSGWLGMTPFRFSLQTRQHYR